MASKYWVAMAAWTERGKNWRENTDRILEYFFDLDGPGLDPRRRPQEQLVHLLRALVPGASGRLTAAERRNLRRFHAVASGTYQPKAGDLYYLPKHNNHVGVIVGVSGNSIWTVDGNAGPGKFDARFFVSYDKNGAPVKRIGDGFVYFSGVPKTLGANDFYIETPE